MTASLEIVGVISTIIVIQASPANIHCRPTRIQSLTPVITEQ